jgi:PAS domain S-box-containing protein
MINVFKKTNILIETMLKFSKRKKEYIEFTIFSLILFGTYLTSFYSYLLFHTIAELFSIIIAGGIFVIGWNSRKYMDSSFFLILGISSLFIGCIDLIHTLAYTGMGIFIGYESNLPTSLWIAARYLQAFSMLLAIFFLKREVNPTKVLVSYTFITVFLITLIFTGFFPQCYIEGEGLTPFKIVSEYIIISLLFLSIILLYLNRIEFDKRIYQLIVVSIIITMISELAFTLYVSVYGISNLIGHLFKIVAFSIIYIAIIERGLEKPWNIMFRKLKQSEENLEIKARDLERAYSEADQIFKASLPLRIIDKNCVIINVNDTFSELFNVRKEEVLGKKCYELFPHDKCHTESCALKQIISGKEQYEYEIEYKQGDRSKLVLIVNTVPYISASGEFLGIIQNYTDITDRKQAEKRLEHLISTVSHELRTPITVLLMSLDYLKNHRETITTELEERLMEGISRNVKLLNKLAEDILIISRIDEKRLEIEWIEYNALEIINEILTLMEPIGKEKNITIEVDMDENIHLMGDPKRIDQIFRILIDNAIKYSEPNSKIKIKALENYKGRYDVNNEIGVLFQIKDYGMGIPNKDLPHLFERFYRSDQVKEISGTGLGLSIARELTHLHKGEIFVESEFEKGSSFFVFLPKIDI